MRQSIIDFRKKHPSTYQKLLAQKRAKEALAAQSERVKLQRAWEKNLALLDEESRGELMERAEEVQLLTRAMRLCGKFPDGVGVHSPDPVAVYRFLKEAIADYGMVTSWCPDDCAPYAILAEDWSDPIYKDTGLRCSVTELFFNHYKCFLKTWAKTHACDPQVAAELVDVALPTAPAVPATPASFQTIPLSKREQENLRAVAESKAEYERIQNLMKLMRASPERFK